MVYTVLVHNPFCWYRPMSYIAWSIRKITGSYYNHCVTVIESNNGKFVFDQQNVLLKTSFTKWEKKGIRIKREAEWIRVHTKDMDGTVCGITSPLTESCIIENADRLVGTKYDYLNTLVYQTLHIYLKKKFGVDKWPDTLYGINIIRGGRMQCYESNRAILGLPDPNKATPYK